MSEIIAAVIGAVVALISNLSVLYMQNRLGKRRETSIRYVKQYASLYELEKLYVSEISRLRKLAGENDNEQTIKNSFRKKNEENDHVHIQLTSSSANDFAEKLERKL